MLTKHLRSSGVGEDQRWPLAPYYLFIWIQNQFNLWRIWFSHQIWSNLTHIWSKHQNLIKRKSCTRSDVGRDLPPKCKKNLTKLCCKSDDNCVTVASVMDSGYAERLPVNPRQSVLFPSSAVSAYAAAAQLYYPSLYYPRMQHLADELE